MKLFIIIKLESSLIINLTLQNQRTCGFSPDHLASIRAHSSPPPFFLHFTMLPSNHLAHLTFLPFPHPSLSLLHLRSSSLHFLRLLHRSSSFRVAATSPQSRLAELPSPPQLEVEGPVELPSSSLFATDDNLTPLQVAISVCLTGAITVFLFRSLRRRARRAKELVRHF
jgi:hypothetical protein